MKSLSIIAAGFAAALVIAGPARAAQVDFSTVLRTEEGKPFIDCQSWEGTPGQSKCEKTADMTLGSLARGGLNVPEQGLAADEFIRRGMLARAIFKQPKQDLSAEDIKMIKDVLVKRGYSPVLMLGAFELLDPLSVKPRQ